MEQVFDGDAVGAALGEERRQFAVNPGESCGKGVGDRRRDGPARHEMMPAAAEIAMIPQNYVKLEGKDAQQMLKLMEALDDHDDVQHVWANFDIEEKEIEASLA